MTSAASVLPSATSASRRALLLALAFGLVSAVLVFAYLSKAHGPGATGATVPVLVAAQDIGLGDEITDQNVALKQIPVAAVHPNAFTDKTRGTALHQMATEPISAGQQILSSQVARDPAQVGFSPIIPQGDRAVAIAVSDQTDGNGLIRPGDYVDVVASFQANTPPPGTAVVALPKNETEDHVYVAVTVAENVRVLAVGQAAEQPQLAGGGSNAKPAQGQPSKSVTLALTPAEAQKVFLAEQIGSLRLAERRLGDTSVTPLAPQDNSLASLLAAPPR
jgi:pilus assembly protein CpaB